MGLDIALAVVTLLGAIRGWFKGFVLQAIQLGALVGCVYLADPVRDLARPYALDYLPAIQPSVLDKLLWWTAAVLSYVVISGAAVSIVRQARKRSMTDDEVRRGDQGLGFLFGGLKGGLVACFLAWGLVTHAPRYIQEGGWVGEQVSTSRSLKLTEQYQPAERFWTSEPVQQLVGRVRSRGFGSSESGDISEPDRSTGGDAAEVKTARPAASAAKPPNRVATRPKPLEIPAERPLDPHSPRFLEELDEALRRAGLLDEDNPASP